MKIINFSIVLIVSVLWWGNVSSTVFARGVFSPTTSSDAEIVRRIVTKNGISAEVRQRIIGQYRTLHHALVSQIFDQPTRLKFEAFEQELKEVNDYPQEAMLYIAAVAGNQDAAAAVLDELNDSRFTLGEALELAMKDGPNWEAFELLVNLGRSEAQLHIDLFTSGAVEANDEEKVERLIAAGGDANRALRFAAFHGDKKIAQRVIELGADAHEALYLVQDIVTNDRIRQAAKFLTELGADANLALLAFANSYNEFVEYLTVKELNARNLVSDFGADPFLVSAFVENTKGFEYLDGEHDVRSGSKATEQFVKELEYLTPHQARHELKNRGVSVNLALLYLAQRKDAALAKYLIKSHGANPTTVIAVAQAGGDEETASFLLGLISPARQGMSIPIDLGTVNAPSAGTVNSPIRSSQKN